MSSWLNLEGKRALITGGAQGLGFAMAESLAAVGVRILIADIDEDHGKKAVEALPPPAEGSHAFTRCDVTQKDDAESAVACAIDQWGGLDILLNNAGIVVARMLVDPAGKEELTEEILDRVIGINMKGLFLCAQAAARHMIEAGSGVIINVASESGSEGSQGQSAYAATKAAAYNLTYSWARELGPKGVRVVGIAPGILEATAFRSEAYEESLAYTRGITAEELRLKYASPTAIPLGRSGKLTEIADLVTFLASDRSSYIHGTVINISGGKSRA